MDADDVYDEWVARKWVTRKEARDYIADFNSEAAYITRDSGNRAKFDSGMVRDTNHGKPRFDLLFPKDVPYEKQPLYRLAMLLARGAEKYDARNWEQADPNGPEAERFNESGLRHYAQAIAGETEEDHYAAVLFNVLGAMTMEAKR